MKEVHCSQPARAANGMHLRERHFRPSGAKAYAVAHEPVTRNRTAGSRSAITPQDLCQNPQPMNKATMQDIEGNEFCLA